MRPMPKSWERPESPQMDAINRACWEDGERRLDALAQDLVQRVKDSELKTARETHVRVARSS